MRLCGSSLAQNMEYKFIELLSCDFLQSSEEVIRQQMAFRYNSLKSKLALMHVSAWIRDTVVAEA